MNNRGQVIFFAFMLAIAIIVLALGLARPIRQQTDISMNYTNSSGMDCGNSSISDFTKAGCYIADVSPAYFIGGLIALAGIIAISKIIFGG